MRNKMFEMLPVECRQKSIPFRMATSFLPMDCKNDLHWLVYSAYKWSLITTLIFETITILYFVSLPGLNEEVVVAAIRNCILLTSAFVFVIIVPLFIFKIRRVVGFSQVDYLDAFPRKIPRTGWALHRSKIISKASLVIVLLIPGYSLGWMSLKGVLAHYDLLTSVPGIASWFILYAFISNVMISPVLLLFFMIRSQYKNHFSQIPAHQTANLRGAIL